MAEPLTDADPEKFVIGRGVYDSFRTAWPCADERVFRIEPMPLPVRSLVVSGLIFAVSCSGFYWARQHLAPADVEPWLKYAVPIVIGSLAYCLFMAVVCCSLLAIRSLGPCFVFEKASGRVELPWENEVFERDDIVQIQYITTKRLDWGDSPLNEQCSELNLITLRGGLRQRWPMLRSMANVKAFDYIVKPLIAHTGLPVIRVEDERLGRQVTEKPYS